MSQEDGYNLVIIKGLCTVFFTSVITKSEHEYEKEIPSPQPPSQADVEDGGDHDLHLELDVIPYHITAIDSCLRSWRSRRSLTYIPSGGWSRSTMRGCGSWSSPARHAGWDSRQSRHDGLIPS